ncbi:acyltransferase family protein [Thermoactinospora rubra]|uniref:acyltransferase family protein n=1 Tax=Thermoactinospora rubra TaxID=1088767 RepID=UPI001F0A711F|nr:acyltransferase [Thermoactinospora rubra]
MDGIRAVAALYVALHHMWLGVWQGYPANDGPWWVGWLAYGHLGVAVFIVLSGFSLAIEPGRNDQRLVGGARRFFRRRAWRIVPTYWAAIALSCLLLLVRDEKILGHDGAVLGEQPVTLKGVIVHGLLLQDVIGSESPNGAFWSIAIEWQIYFLFPILLVLLRRTGLAVLVASVTALVLATQLLAVNVALFEPLLNLVPQFLALFVFGMAGAQVLSRPPGARFAPLALATAGLGAAVLVAWFWAAGSAAVIPRYFWIDLAVGALTALLLAGLATMRSDRLRALFEVRFLRWTGRFSYSVYLVHAPILGIVWQFGVVPLGLSPVPAFLAIVLAGTPAIILGSWLFAQAFEEPVLRHRSWGALRAALVTRIKGSREPAPVAE